MASGKGHGGMSLSMKLIRLTIMLFNMIFVIIGCALLVIGILIIKDPKIKELRPLLDPNLTSTSSSSLSTLEIFAIILIVIGGILLLIGFFGQEKLKSYNFIFFCFLGCCGAIKTFRFLHLIYAIVIGGIILIEIIVIIIFVIYQNRFKTEFVTNLQKSIANDYIGLPFTNSTPTNSISLAWDYAQFSLHCCGAVNKTDYVNATNWNRTNPYQANSTLAVPFTCCPLNIDYNGNGIPTNMTGANTCAITGINAYSQGCYDRLMDLLSKYKLYVIIGGIIVGVVEILALLFAILLYCRRNDYENV